MLAEFMMVHHLLSDIPPEFTGDQVGAEILRRCQGIFDETQRLENENERIEEDGNILSTYMTPYDHMIMPHMAGWNQLLIDAIKTPAQVDKQLFYKNSRKAVQKEGAIFSHWFICLGEWRILDSYNNMTTLAIDQIEHSERFENLLKREPLSAVTKMIFQKISSITFDYVMLVSNQVYATTIANKWTYEEVINKLSGEIFYNLFKFRKTLKKFPKRQLSFRRRQMCHAYLMHDEQWGHPATRNRPKRQQENMPYHRYKRSRLMPCRPIDKDSVLMLSDEANDC